MTELRIGSRTGEIRIKVAAAASAARICTSWMANSQSHVPIILARNRWADRCNRAGVVGLNIARAVGYSMARPHLWHLPLLHGRQRIFVTIHSLPAIRVTAVRHLDHAMHALPFPWAKSTASRAGPFAVRRLIGCARCDCRRGKKRDSTVSAPQLTCGTWRSARAIGVCLHAAGRRRYSNLRPALGRGLAGGSDSHHPSRSTRHHFCAVGTLVPLA